MPQLGAFDAVKKSGDRSGPTVDAPSGELSAGRSENDRDVNAPVSSKNRQGGILVGPVMGESWHECSNESRETGRHGKRDLTWSI
jgi:hypothetical protein